MIPGLFWLIMSFVLKFVFQWVNRINMEMSSVKLFIIEEYKWKPVSCIIRHFLDSAHIDLIKIKKKKMRTWVLWKIWNNPIAPHMVFWPCFFTWFNKQQWKKACSFRDDWKSPLMTHTYSWTNVKAKCLYFSSLWFIRISLIIGAWSVRSEAQGEAPLQSTSELWAVGEESQCENRWPSALGLELSFPMQWPGY